MQRTVSILSIQAKRKCARVVVMQDTGCICRASSLTQSHYRQHKTFNEIFFVCFGVFFLYKELLLASAHFLKTAYPLAEHTVSS